MNCRIKDALSHMNCIYNDNDMSSFWNLDSLVNPISDSKEFGLSWGDIDSVMNCFLDIIKMRMDVRDICGNIVSNTSVRNNDDRFGIQWCIWEDIVKIMKISGFAFFIFAVCSMKRKITNCQLI